MTSRLLAAMAGRYPEDEWRVLFPGGSAQLPPGTSAYRTRIPRRLLFGAAAIAERPRLDVLVGGVDVVWVPAPAPIAVSPDVPLVLTLHDLSWVQRPRDFTPYERVWHLLARPRSLAGRAARVAAVSEQTRRVALDVWSLEPDRVAVIQPPVTACPDRAGPSRELGGPYFLWVGALEPRKAPEVLESAWAKARSRGLDARLIVVGDGRLSISGPRVERRGWVGDAELCALYSGAIALVMPSFLEGAGLPPLEAALHGTPSICSDLAVLRESLGPAGAEWVESGDADALANAMLLIARDGRRRDEVAAAAMRAATPRANPAPAAIRMRTLLADAAQA